MNEFENSSSLPNQSPENQDSEKATVVGDTRRKIFFVDTDFPEDGIVEYSLGDTDKPTLLYEDGDASNWYLTGPSHVHIYEGDHYERGDRDEDVRLEDEEGDEYFTFDRSKAEQRLAVALAKAESVRLKREAESAEAKKLKQLCEAVSAIRGKALEFHGDQEYMRQHVRVLALADKLDRQEIVLVLEMLRNHLSRNDFYYEMKGESGLYRAVLDLLKMAERLDTDGSF